MIRIASALLLVLASLPVAAGVVFEIETVDKTAAAGQAADTIHTVVDGKRIKIDVKGPRGADADMIYRGDARELMAVDHARKSYVLLDEAAFQAIGEQLSAFEAQMQEALKDVPPEQRAMMEEMMKQRMGQQMPAENAAAPVNEIRRTSDTGEQNGYPCVRYELHTDGRHSKDIWVTDWDNVEGGRDAMAAFEDMAEFMRELNSAMPSFAQSPEQGSHAYEHLKELGGFPVVTIEYDASGNATSESRLRTSRVETVDALTFEAPAGYRQEQLFQ
ncbi:MAG: hypothetical protein QNJ00_05355 [Woeseiaceae bacterium]|nr:hypothetical protein [Woeseiaceae bacterium]